MSNRGDLSLIVAQKTGILAKVSLWLGKHDYRVMTNYIDQNGQTGTSTLTLHLQGEFPIPAEVLKELGTIPECISVNMDDAESDVAESDVFGQPREFAQELENADSEPRYIDIDSITDNMWRRYPKINKRLTALSSNLPDDRRSEVLQQLGGNIASLVYQKDFALESQVDLNVALKKILAPALKPFGRIQLDGNQIIFIDNLLCEHKDNNTISCEFLQSFMVGLLNSGNYQNTVVRNTCVNRGDPDCRFTIAE